jgi:hypothetical protein
MATIQLSYVKVAKVIALHAHLQAFVLNVSIIIICLQTLIHV